MKPTLLCFVISFLFVTDVHAQSVQHIENRIVSYLDQINRWDTSYSYDGATDSLSFAHKALLDYLELNLSKASETISYGFPKLEHTQFAFLTSDDKKFRLYFWLDKTFGGNFSSNVVAQYKGLKGTRTTVLNDISKMQEGEVSSGLYYTGLYTIKTNLGETVYLAVGAQKISAGLYIYNIQAFKVDKDKLNDTVKFFETRKGSVNNIGYEVEATQMGENDPSIKVSVDKNKVYIPLLAADGTLTSKYLIYRFDGNNYVFDKNLK